MKYFIEHWLQTLSQNGVMSESSPASFLRLEIKFSHYDFSNQNGWRENAWIASGHIDAENHLEAVNKFRSKLQKIIPKISLIGQAYIDFVSQSFLVTKEGDNFALLRYVTDTTPVPLMFMEKELSALDALMKNESIPEEFYFHWNDMVNTSGSTPKFLSMFSAIEALSKRPNGKPDWEKRKLILGEELTNDLWEISDNGLRHRLIHGNYFIKKDVEKDYFDLIHKKVIGYFNKNVFAENLIEENINQPQRHFFGNKEWILQFVRPRGRNTLNIIDILFDFNKNGTNNMENYEYEWEKNLN